MAKDFFTAEEKQRIREAIRAAEDNTSGEIQVHLENRSMKPVPERATEIFNILKVYNTAKRNGVLFYLAVKDRQFAVLGDTGIDRVAGPTFWDNIKQHMEAMFREGKFTDGLCEGIRMAGEQLRTYFPVQKDDRNELPDDISFGNN
jgi:uncharacterized membrane protein